MGAVDDDEDDKRLEDDAGDEGDGEEMAGGEESGRAMATVDWEWDGSVDGPGLASDGPSTDLAGLLSCPWRSGPCLSWQSPARAVPELPPPTTAPARCPRHSPPSLSRCPL